MRQFFFGALYLIVVGNLSAEPLQERYDVVIAGAGTGGCGAAIQAARLGASVLLLEETDWIGGQMNAAAVTSMDEGGPLVRSRGLYHELTERIENHYAPLGINPNTAYWFSKICVEPRIGQKILREMLTDAGKKSRLDVSLRSRVIKVLKEGDKVTGVEIAIAGQANAVVSSQVLIDATEWGDVLPLTGVRYRAGNRINGNIDPKRRVQDNTWTAVVKQYPQGTPKELITTQPPPGYEKAEAIFKRSLVVGDKIDSKARPQTWSSFIGYRGMPDSSRPGDAPPITRTHLNYNNDFMGTAAEMEDSTQRLATGRAMRLRTLQLIYYFQNVLGIKDWAVANDEGYDTAYNRTEIDAWLKEQPELEPFRAILYHFPPIPYVRESRRLVGLHTLKAGEIARAGGKKPVQFPSTVALGDYRLDLHGGKAPVDIELDLDTLEDIEAAKEGGGSGPYAIPFESFIPEKVDGFLAAEKNISQTRLVNGSSRMQPHTMNMGQAAGAIAALSIKHKVQPRALEPVLVQRVLLGASDTLAIAPVKDVPQAAPDWAAIQLVLVHGQMSLDDSGRFGPQEPLKDTALSREAFAKALAEEMKPGRVTLHFEASPAEGAKPITRSEAAQVIAESLELKALAKMKQQNQTLEWTALRPASKAMRGDVTLPILADLQRLKDRGIIDSTDYWIEHAIEGESCDGAKVADLMTKAAQAFDPSATAATSVAVLARESIIGSPDYWLKTARPGGQCVGKNVATVIRNLGKRRAVMQKQP